jgi:hypothetical protein
VNGSAKKVRGSFNIVFKISYKSHTIMREIFFMKKRVSRFLHQRKVLGKRIRQKGAEFI